MSHVTRTLPAAAVAAILVWSIVRLSNAPMDAHGSADALLRLAWSARPERVETCRQLTPEELSTVPAHMRQPIVCEGTTASYRLEVRQNGRVLAEQIVQGGGLRRDRRLYVFRELAVPPGKTTISVRMDRVTAATATSDDRRRADSVPAHLAFERSLTFSPREVVLVTYDPERRALVAVQEGNE